MYKFDSCRGHSKIPAERPSAIAAYGVHSRACSKRVARALSTPPTIRPVIARVQKLDGSLEPARSVDITEEPELGDYLVLDDGRRVQMMGAARQPDGRLLHLIVAEVGAPRERRRPVPGDPPQHSWELTACIEF